VEKRSGWPSVYFPAASAAGVDSTVNRNKPTEDKQYGH